MEGVQELLNLHEAKSVEDIDAAVLELYHVADRLRHHKFKQIEREVGERLYGSANVASGRNPDQANQDSEPPFR